MKNGSRILIKAIGLEREIGSYIEARKREEVRTSFHIYKDCLDLNLTIFSVSDEDKEYQSIREFLRDIKDCDISDLLLRLLWARHTDFLDEDNIAVTSNHIAVEWNMLKEVYEKFEEANMRENEKDYGDEEK